MAAAMIVSRSTRLSTEEVVLNVMACEHVLMIWGATYPNRLWCIRELFTLVAFMSLDQASKSSHVLNVMACEQVLMIWGATCPNRLWCIRELFTLVVSTSKDTQCCQREPLRGP